MSQDKIRGACNDKNLFNSNSTHQYHDNSQKVQSNVATPHGEKVVPQELVTVHDKQVAPQNLVTVPKTPIQGDLSDPNAVLQSHDTTVDNFTREEVVPLYIWANRNSSNDYKACIQQNGDQFGYHLMT